VTERVIRVLYSPAGNQWYAHITLNEGTEQETTVRGAPAEQFTGAVINLFDAMEDYFLGRVLRG
jgi:hypothetical protein